MVDSAELINELASEHGGEHGAARTLDRPIASRSEDKLDRASFAGAIADDIYAWPGRESFVIGLQGEWGAGKTSIVRMIKEYLLEKEHPPHIVDYNPWEWSGHEELATAFFGEIEANFDGKSSPVSHTLARRFRSYSVVLNAGVSIGKSLGPILAAISTIMLIAGVSVLRLDGNVPSALGTALAVLGVLGVLGSQSSAVLDEMAKVLDQVGNGRSRSLRETKAALEESLHLYSRNFLIVVDDIDRLTPSDAVRLLQIVKVNSDLPRMIFCSSIHDEISRH
jgi:hypothetical protein